MVSLISILKSQFLKRVLSWEASVVSCHCFTLRETMTSAPSSTSLLRLPNAVLIPCVDVRVQYLDHVTQVVLPALAALKPYD